MKTLLLTFCLLGLGPAFFFVSTSGEQGQDDPTLTEMLKDAEQLGVETKTGRILADRLIARSLIDVGLRTNNPEAILVGVNMLQSFPAIAAVDSPESLSGNDALADHRELENWIDQAADMRPEDALLASLIKRAQDRLEENPRGLAGGPKRWTVKIKKGGYYQLDPKLVYNAHEKAIISAWADDKTVLGISVRRLNQQKEHARSVRKGKVTTSWNAGIHKSGWDVRIYNLVGPGTKTVRVETN